MDADGISKQLIRLRILSACLKRGLVLGWFVFTLPWLCALLLSSVTP